MPRSYSQWVFFLKVSQSDQVRRKVDLFPRHSRPFQSLTHLAFSGRSPWVGGVTVGQPSQLLMFFLFSFRKQHPPFSGRQCDQCSAESEPGLERARGALRPRRGEDGRHEEQRPAVCRNCTQGGSRSAAKGSALGCQGALVPRTLFQYVSHVGGTKSSLFFFFGPCIQFPSAT